LGAQAYCGNVSAQPSTCFAGAPLCQHGDAECAGDRFEACAASLPQVSALQSAEFAFCLEAGGLDVTRADACAVSSGIGWGALSACAADGSATGDAATTAAANVTAQYGYMYPQAGGWAGTPTVVLNGATLVTTVGLLAQVCNAAGADAPVGCGAAQRAKPPPHAHAAVGSANPQSSAARC
jgi:hypothetical protein